MIVRFLLALEAALLGAALGAFALFFGTILIGLLAGAETREGGLAMGAAGLTPVGGLLGACVGMWLGWRLASKLTSAVAAGISLGVIALCLLPAAGWYLHQELTDGDPYPLDQPRPLIQMEIRLPYKVGHHLVDPFYRKSWISHDGRHGHVRWDEPRARDEGNVTVLRLQKKLYYRVPGRKLRFWRKDAGGKTVFDLKIPPEPVPTEDYGPWMETPDGVLAIRIKITMQAPAG
ncbi:MAG: hypothetical protein AAF441_28470 [Pseudomonadota bacterium]